MLKLKYIDRAHYLLEIYNTLNKSIINSENGSIQYKRKEN